MTTDSVEHAKATYTTDAPHLFAALGSNRRALWHLTDLAMLFDRVYRFDTDPPTCYAVDLAALALAVAELVDAGAVESWNHPDGPAYILSAHSAELLDIELDNTGRRWRPRGRSPRVKNKRRKDVKTATDAGVDLEHFEEECAPELDFTPPRPTILLGERLQWNGPRAMSRHWDVIMNCWTVCPGCFDALPTPSRYCLCCDNKPAPKRDRKKLSLPPPK